MYDNNGTNTIERHYKGRKKDSSPISEDPGSQKKTPQRRNLQEEILPQEKGKILLQAKSTF